MIKYTTIVYFEDPISDGVNCVLQ